MDFSRIYSRFKFSSILFGLAFVFSAQAQNASFQTDLLKPDPAKEAMFLPYLAVRHGGMEAIEEWKSKNTYKYYQELWYYSESFYVKRNHFLEGSTFNESVIDISRFESSRKSDEEAMVIFPGFKDVLILFPSNKLIYSPATKK
jgi:hypothetical protein